MDCNCCNKPIIYKNGVPYEVRLTFKGWLYCLWLSLFDHEWREMKREMRRGGGQNL